MEVKSITAFLAYYERTREITCRVIELIPRDRLDFAYMPGKYSLADLVRHIAAIERNAFAEIVLGKRPAYKGCGKELADGYDAIMAYFHEMHRQSMEIVGALQDDDLPKKITALNGKEVELGNFLRALIVHEIHHRAALCLYLNMLQIQTPPVLGLTAEQVMQLGETQNN